MAHACTVGLADMQLSHSAGSLEVLYIDMTVRLAVNTGRAGLL